MTLLQRYLAYLDKLPPAISGSGGHDATFRAACEGFRFGLSAAEVGEGLRAYNVRCQPPWTEKELAHKVADAEKKVGASGERGKRVGFTGSGKPKRSQKNLAAASLRIAKKHAARRAKREALPASPIGPARPELSANRKPTESLGIAQPPTDLPAVGNDIYGPLPQPGLPVVAQGRDVEQAWYAREFAAMGLPDPVAVSPAEFRRAVAITGNDDADYWQFILTGEAEAVVCNSYL